MTLLLCCTPVLCSCVVLMDCLLLCRSVSAALCWLCMLQTPDTHTFSLIILIIHIMYYWSLQRTPAPDTYQADVSWLKEFDTAKKPFSQGSQRFQNGEEARSPGYSLYIVFYCLQLHLIIRSYSSRSCSFQSR